MIEVSHSTRGELPPGTLIAGRYRVTTLLGRGGMGAVYEAEHVELGRQVALKTLLPQAGQSEQQTARLLREARAAARIGHPGIVDVFDLLEHEGTAFVVMERLHGEELHQRIQREGRLSVAFALRMGIEVSGAIAAAHEHGIIHRDLKPRNVFIARDARLGEVFKVLDFGIAKLTHDVDMRLATGSGHVVGTPAYMAPERLAGAAAVDGRADIYAIGALLYEALSGRPPHEAKSYPELVLRVSSEAPRPIVELREDVPAALGAAIARALSRDPGARQQSASELGAELAAIETTSMLDSGCRPTAPQALIALSGQTTATVLQPAVAAGANGAAGSQPGQRARAPRIALAVLALVVLAFLARSAVMTFAGSTTPARAHAAAKPGTSAPPPSSVISAPLDRPAHAAPAVALAPAPVLAPAAPGTLDPIEVVFESRPAGAKVAIDGVHACVAPCTRALARDRGVAVQLTLRGYAPQRRVLAPPLPARVSVELVPRPAPAAVPAELPGLPPLLPR